MEQKKRIDRYTVGMPTLAELDSLQENIDTAKELHIGFIEINLDIPIFSNIQQLKHLVEKSSNDIYFTLHLPEDLNFLSFIDTFRNCYLHYLEEIANTFKPTYIKKIIGHLSQGVYFNLPNEKFYLIEKHHEKYFEILQDSFLRISRILSETGHQLNIENTGIGNIAIISETIDQIIQYKNIKLTHDIGHEVKNNNSDSEYLQKYKTKIDHYHVHDYNGYRDHQELFTGNIPIQIILDRVGAKNHTIVIEVKSKNELRNSIKKLIEKGIMV